MDEFCGDSISTDYRWLGHSHQDSHPSAGDSTNFESSSNDFMDSTRMEKLRKVAEMLDSLDDQRMNGILNSAQSNGTAHQLSSFQIQESPTRRKAAEVVSPATSHETHTNSASGSNSLQRHSVPAQERTLSFVSTPSKSSASFAEEATKNYSADYDASLPPEKRSLDEEYSGFQSILGQTNPSFNPTYDTHMPSTQVRSESRTTSNTLPTQEPAGIKQNMGAKAPTTPNCLPSRQAISVARPVLVESVPESYRDPPFDASQHQRVQQERARQPEQSQLHHQPQPQQQQQQQQQHLSPQVQQLPQQSYATRPAQVPITHRQPSVVMTDRGLPTAYVFALFSAPQNDIAVQELTHALDALRTECEQKNQTIQMLVHQVGKFATQPQPPPSNPVFENRNNATAPVPAPAPVAVTQPVQQQPQQQSQATTYPETTEKERVFTKDPSDHNRTSTATSFVMILEQLQKELAKSQAEIRWLHKQRQREHEEWERQQRQREIIREQKESKPAATYSAPIRRTSNSFPSNIQENECLKPTAQNTADTCASSTAAQKYPWEQHVSKPLTEQDMPDAQLHLPNSEKIYYRLGLDKIDRQCNVETANMLKTALVQLDMPFDLFPQAIGQVRRQLQQGRRLYTWAQSLHRHLYDEEMSPGLVSRKCLMNMMNEITQHSTLPKAAVSSKSRNR
ncbi:SIN component scaffold protein Sid4 [Schizosaccharomyces japonicus yFS275]|uniref:SIN component scaffold protein Sid4 n=1 Tax=Schizosaccharomyces japonicus (strain yFS275 / FY16936) TaxID=402676 RepID=B6JY04_SCHJY|nr:SIN component scaffold protein Sid4 [Schizosaccharomyces japonicus yFS275]EEB06422.1 SIN component scaffold protein Sid4 [Schizosaccharomyces japonicus yFS275]